MAAEAAASPTGGGENAGVGLSSSAPAGAHASGGSDILNGGELYARQTSLVAGSAGSLPAGGAIDKNMAALNRRAGDSGSAFDAALHGGHPYPMAGSLGRNVAGKAHLNVATQNRREGSQVVKATVADYSASLGRRDGLSMAGHGGPNSAVKERVGSSPVGTADSGGSSVGSRHNSAQLC